MPFGLVGVIENESPFVKREMSSGVRSIVERLWTLKSISDVFGGRPNHKKESFAVKAFLVGGG